MRKIKIKLFENGRMPVYKTAGASCADCFANKSVLIKKGERELVPLGFGLELPKNYEAVIRPRSGLSKNKIDVIIGTIDCDYRNEISANVVNNSEADILVKMGDRICQLKIQKANQFQFEVVNKLSETERGLKGFGSTGLQ